MKRTITLLALAVAAALPLAAPAANADDVPSGRQAVYRVSVEGTWTTTGIAVSREGTVLTAASILSHCPAEGACRIWVEAPEPDRDLWYRATLAATDPVTGLAVLRTAALPSALRLGTRAARPGEPLHAYAYDGNEARFLAGNVRSVSRVSYPGNPPVSGNGLLSSIACPNGAAGTGLVATADDAVLGIVYGTTDDGDTIAVPSSTIRAFLDARHIPYDRPAPARHARR
ncbi:MAG TPA: serine protease [Candidatus Eisenbacteria bacterium]|nr:serine protease [Candidatus Eisenbacteria bacterium]